MHHKFDLNYENFLVVRPLWAKFSYGKYNIPIMWKPKISLKKAAYSDLLNFRNLSTKRNLENRIIENFAYDFELETIWRNPFTHFFELHKALAVLTPDYSITSGMAEAQIIENTYKNRWMGCFWQQFSISVIPTVSWAGPSTYKICQIGIPKHSPIAVSTLGVADKKIFLDGYNYFLQKIDPPFVICYGKMIQGMTGNIIPFCYEEAFMPPTEYEQLKLFSSSRLIAIDKEEK